MTLLIVALVALALLGVMHVALTSLHRNELAELPALTHDDLVALFEATEGVRDVSIQVGRVVARLEHGWELSSDGSAYTIHVTPTADARPFDGASSWELSSDDGAYTARVTPVEDARPIDAIAFVSSGAISQELRQSSWGASTYDFIFAAQPSPWVAFADFQRHGPGSGLKAIRLTGDTATLTSTPEALRDFAATLPRSLAVCERVAGWLSTTSYDENLRLMCAVADARMPREVRIRAIGELVRNRNASSEIARCFEAFDASARTLLAAYVRHPFDGVERRLWVDAIAPSMGAFRETIVGARLERLLIDEFAWLTLEHDGFDWSLRERATDRALDARDAPEDPDARDDSLVNTIVGSKQGGQVFALLQSKGWRPGQPALERMVREGDVATCEKIRTYARLNLGESQVVELARMLHARGIDVSSLVESTAALAASAGRLSVAGAEGDALDGALSASAQAGALERVEP